MSRTSISIHFIVIYSLPLWFQLSQLNLNSISESLQIIYNNTMLAHTYSSANIGMNALLQISFSALWEKHILSFEKEHRGQNAEEFVWYPSLYICFHTCFNHVQSLIVCARQAWPVNSGCLRHLGTTSYLYIYRGFVLPYNRFCICFVLWLFSIYCYIHYFEFDSYMYLYLIYPYVLGIKDTMGCS
jgi:hypothetical protein